MGRSEQEAELARILANVQGKERRQLLTALGEPPDLDNLTPDFWQQYSHGLRKELVPALEKIFLASAQAMLDATPALGVSWDLVNTAASEWARQYGFDLVSGITDTTREALQQKVAGFYENQMTMAQFKESLEPLFGPVRAEMIAVTETTRAAVQGQAGVVNELNKTGIVMQPFFITSEDETVCPLCSPLNGKKVDESEFPPIHPRCRCDIAYKFEKSEDEPAEAAMREHPVSDALALPGGAVGDSARRALDDINAVHDDGELPRIPLTASGAKTRYGAYRSRLHDGSPVNIDISRQGDHKEFTVAHEVGHFLDQHGFGVKGRFSSESDPLLDEWREAVKNSAGIQHLLEMRKAGKLPEGAGVSFSYTVDREYIGYLLNTKEVWARSYSQYIAVKSGDRVMLDQLAKEQPGSNPYAPQWSDEDFKPIAKAIDALFAVLGWIP